MQNKLKKLSKYFLYILMTNSIYGLILFFTFTWLSGFSLPLAYLGNFALIVLGLAWDECNQKWFGSKKLVTQIKKDKDVEKNYRFIKQVVDNFVSFKTALYLFYIIILIVSQMLEFYPALFGEKLSNFILANDYSILFLVAIDMLIGQFSKERERMKKVSEYLEKSLVEKKENE